MPDSSEKLKSVTSNEKLESTNVVTEQRGHHEGLQDIRETQARVPPEVKSWMRKIEEDPGQMKTVHDDNGQPVLVPTPNQNPKVVLPITREKFVEGFKKSINEAGRWLSGFLLKLIKKRKGNVKFKQE